MFNVYLPKLLEGRGGDDGAAKSLEDNLWDVVIYTVGGCPGAIVSCCQLPIFPLLRYVSGADWCLASRLATGPSVVVSREHTPDSAVLPFLRLGAASLGCASEHGGDQLECYCELSITLSCTRRTFLLTLQRPCGRFCTAGRLRYSTPKVRLSRICSLHPRIPN